MINLSLQISIQRHLTSMCSAANSCCSLQQIAKAEWCRVGVVGVYFLQSPRHLVISLRGSGSCRVQESPETGRTPRQWRPCVVRPSPPLLCAWNISICEAELTLILILLTWRKWWTPNNASKWQMGFNSAFKGLSTRLVAERLLIMSQY
jgi:hypothetical protein